jgi:hypothetical protein
MDTKNAYVGERDALEALRYDWALPAVEAAAVEMLRRKVKDREI